MDPEVSNPSKPGQRGSLLHRQQASANAEATKLAMRRQKALYDAQLDLAMQAAEEERQEQESWLGPTPSELLERWFAAQPDLDAEEQARLLSLGREILAQVEDGAAPMDVDHSATPPEVAADEANSEIDEHVQDIVAEALSRQREEAWGRAGGILHAEGCTAPSQAVASGNWLHPIVNPAIVLVADGRGGEVSKCTLCGSTTALGQAKARSKARPTVTAEQAIEAYQRLGSDRKAARELLISRTQVRRLRGVQT